MSVFVRENCIVLLPGAVQWQEFLGQAGHTRSGIAGTPEIQNQFRQCQWQQLSRSPATLKIVMIQVQTGLSAIQVVWGVWALKSELLQCPFNWNKTTHYFYLTLPKKTCLSPWTNKRKYTRLRTHTYPRRRCGGIDGLSLSLGHWKEHCIQSPTHHHRHLPHAIMEKTFMRVYPPRLQ